MLLGIDIGGTKTSVSLGNKGGVLVGALQMPSETERGPEDWFGRLCDLLNTLYRDHDLPGPDAVEAVGISAPGPLSVEKGCLLDPPNMIGWRDVPVVGWVNGRLGFSCPVAMNNDANAAVLAEFLYGRFQGTPDMVYLTLSTGLGAGIMTGGRLLQGACDLGGEAGYMVLDLDGPVSPCGHRGSLEAWCGGLNTANRLRRELETGALSPGIERLTGGDFACLDFRIFLEAVRQRDSYAMARWDTWCSRLAQGIGNLVMVLNPSVVLLGTIGIHAWDLLEAEMAERLPALVHPAALAACRVSPATLGPGIGDFAALALAEQASGRNAGS